MLGFDVINNWDTELKEMNKDKVGEPFHYPNTFLLLLGYAKVYFHLALQTNRRYCTRTCQRKSTFHPRLHYNKQKNKQVRYQDKRYDNKDKEFEDEYIVIAIDSTGIKVTNRGQWMREKWNVRIRKDI